MNRSMKITILGCGNMGTAYARSFRKYGLVLPEDLTLIVRGQGRLAELTPLGMVTVSIDKTVGESDLVIIAVKPQDFGSVAPALASVLRPEQVVLSIMAGITLQRLSENLDHATVDHLGRAQALDGFTPQRDRALGHVTTLAGQQVADSA